MSTTRTQLARGRVRRTRKVPVLWSWDCDCGATGIAAHGVAAQTKLSDHIAHHCALTRPARDRGVNLTPPPITDPAVLAALSDPSLPEGT